MHRLRLELRQHKIWYCNFRNTLGACSPSPPSLQILPPEACYSVLPSDSVNISEAKHTYWHSDRNFKSFSILSSPLFCICLRAWKFTPPPSFKNCSFFFFFILLPTHSTKCLPESKSPFPPARSLMKLWLWLWSIQVPLLLLLHLHVSFPRESNTRRTAYSCALTLAI